jgi:hypothetical protein
MSNPYILKLLDIQIQIVMEAKNVNYLHHQLITKPSRRTRKKKTSETPRIETDVIRQLALACPKRIRIVNFYANYSPTQRKQKNN